MQLLLNIDVDDLERAVAFYSAAFELRLGRRFGADGVELLGGAVPFYLLRKAAGSAAAATTAQARGYQRHWTPLHLDFVVDDLDAALRKALAAGATQEGDCRTEAWGRIVQLADPFGHGFCLIQFLGRGYDEIASG